MQKIRFSEHAKPFLLEGGAHGVLLLHGFTATPGILRPMAEALHAVRLADGQPPTVQAILLPGHGTRVEEMRSQGGHAAWLDAARRGFDALAARCERVSVVGHSMGGVLGLLLAEDDRPVHSLVSVAAPIRLRRRSAYLSPVLGWAVPFLKDGEQRGLGAKEQEYAMTYGTTPVCRVGDLLRLVRSAERGLQKIRCPLLIAQAKDDESVREASVAIIERGVSSAHKRTLWLEQSGHSCPVGKEKQRLFDACATFLCENDGASAAQ